MSDSPASILFDIYGSQLATVSGVDGVRLATDVDGLVGVDPANTGGLALETTISGAAQTLSSLNNKDFATEITQATLGTETTLSGIAKTISSFTAASGTSISSSSFGVLAAGTDAGVVRFLRVDDSGNVFARLLSEGLGVISTVNSTTTPLGSSGVFTGDWEDITGIAVVSVLIRASHASATSGLAVQWSADGITVHEDDTFTIPANDGKTYTFGPVARYFRIVYTNGTQAQTSFVIQTVLRTVYVKPSSHRLADKVSDDDDAELTKAIITGRTPSGEYLNVPLAASGRLQVEVVEPAAPEGTTSIIRTLVGNFNTSDETVYTVTSGIALNVQRVQGGCESTNSSFRAELVVRTTTQGDQLLVAGYANGTNFEFNLDREVIGDGDKRVVLKRVHGGGGTFHAFASWKGFE